MGTDAAAGDAKAGSWAETLASKGVKVHVEPRAGNPPAIQDRVGCTRFRAGSPNRSGVSGEGRWGIAQYGGRGRLLPRFSKATVRGCARVRDPPRTAAGPAPCQTRGSVRGENHKFGG